MVRNPKIDMFNRKTIKYVTHTLTITNEYYHLQRGYYISQCTKLEASHTFSLTFKIILKLGNMSSILHIR